MFKITKCEKCVVYLPFALIATSRLKPGKVLKVIYAWLKVVPVLHFLCSRIAICLLIVYRMGTFSQTKMQDGY